MSHRDTSKPWTYEGTGTSESSHIDLEDLGGRLVEYLQDPTVWREGFRADFDQVEAIKLVHLDRAAEPLTNASVLEPALLMTFHQGVRRYGLLITIERLVHQTGDDDVVAIAGGVILVVDEPHGGVEGGMVWINSLPTANNY